ncbi:LysR family transcriptional regulator [Patulibacter brassicae]|uniref:LysR family transcriptional regulator n=1 Tax=Patulibacter brassicae TaxID=1705717 RepID=A0ABU4VI57_9ACTN|nr:LysR family transcriptional regulator [Patulibacter brassicae]MDX8150829.1 LysR family transcriptional regulator [Patulibacter brassicae]
MDVLQLRVLREVARHGSISAAAEALDYTQPAMSRQLAALERTAGRPLVERTARGTRLTPLGEILLRRAETVLAELDAAQADLERYEDPGERPVRLVTFQTAIASFVPDAIAEVRRRAPGTVVEVELRSDARDATAALHGDRLDVWLVNAAPRERHDARVHAVRRDPFWCCLPVGHPAADAPFVGLRTLARERLVLTADSLCADRALILDACAAAGFRPRVAAHCDDPATTQGLVAAGAGIAILPEMALTARRDDVVLRPLGEPLRRQVLAIVPRDAPPRPGRDELLAALREAGAAWQAPALAGPAGPGRAPDGDEPDAGAVGAQPSASGAGSKIPARSIRGRSPQRASSR